MSIELNNVASGYSTGVINSNFQALEEYINTKLLNRDGVEFGEANQMELPLDMNSNPILNAVTDVNDPGSLINVSQGDERYVNVTGDSMQGSLNMESYPLFVRIAVNGNEPARKDQLDQERSQRISSDQSIINGYTSADANLQSQLTGNAPLEASAFSPISWHSQTINNSVVIPDNVNAWSFGPGMTIAPGQSVTVGQGSTWTIANGEVVE